MMFSTTENLQKSQPFKEKDLARVFIELPVIMLKEHIFAGGDSLLLQSRSFFSDDWEKTVNGRVDSQSLSWND